LGTKQFYLWGGPTGSPTWQKRWKDALYHRLYRRKVVNCFGMTDDRIEWFLSQLNQHRPDAIVAYTNPLYFFARALDERGLKPWKPQAIVVGAEKLHVFQRSLIERVFQCPVFETYGSREFMLIGGECSKHSGLHLTMENLLVEILDDDGQPTAAGEEGNVVITDLTNYGMPFIRYANGDRAVAGLVSCECGRGLPLLAQVVGRRLDTLRTPDGRMVPGEFFPHFLKDFAIVRRFQVIQHTLDDVELKVVRCGSWGAGEREGIISEIQSYLGNGVQFRMSEVDEIPLTAAGKLRVVISHCANHETLLQAS
jgi:phenylacetate-CoA ligase